MDRAFEADLHGRELAGDGVSPGGVSQSDGPGNEAWQRAQATARRMVLEEQARSRRN